MPITYWMNNNNKNPDFGGKKIKENTQKKNKRILRTKVDEREHKLIKIN